MLYCCPFYSLYSQLFQYLNYRSLFNVHWAICTGRLGKRDVGRIEREFLDVLDWDLSVSEADILDHHDSIMNRHNPHTPAAPRQRKPHMFYTGDSEDSDSSTSSISPRTPSTLSSPSQQPTYVRSLSATPEHIEFSEKIPVALSVFAVSKMQSS